MLIYFLIALSVFGMIGIWTLVRALVWNKRANLKLKKPVRFFSVLFLAVMISFCSLYWLFDCYFLERPVHSFTIEKAMDEYGGIKNYQIFDQIDPGFASEKILLVQEYEEDLNEDVLAACYIKTRKMLIGLEKYYANGGAYLINSSIYCGDLIDENFVNGGNAISFPNLWYGIIYPKNRDKIRINGKIPYFHDIHFNGEDYVIWYIEKDAEKAVLRFE